MLHYQPQEILIFSMSTTNDTLSLVSINFWLWNRFTLKPNTQHCVRDQFSSFSHLFTLSTCNVLFSRFQHILDTAKTTWILCCVQCISLQNQALLKKPVLTRKLLHYGCQFMPCLNQTERVLFHRNQPMH